MAAVVRFSKGNLLLNALSVSDLALLEPELKPEEFRLRQKMERPNRTIDDIYFPDTGIVSVVALHPNGNRVEIGIIGCEGATGSPVMLGAERSPHETYVQVMGSGHRMPVPALRTAMEASRSLNDILLRYVQAFMVQTAHTAIANARGRLTERLARWLLMAHDRVPGDDVPLTHEFLALMMGVRRAGVTEALHELAQQKLIRARRGMITILDRKGIETIAGSYYGTPETEYRRLMAGATGRSGADRAASAV